MRRFNAVLLALGIVVLLAWNSADFLFRQPFYEYWDLAANSLSILRAKHFAQLYGPYSRYLFNHPGPAFFYTYAFGEWLFYDVLRLVPTPFQGQVLINLCVQTAFFVASLSMFTRRVPERRRWVFLCVALILGTMHFAMMGNLSSLYNPLGGATAFLSPWSGHSVVVPLLCLLAAGASVAAGGGQDLPWLVLAGGFLMEHLPESVFVGPIGVVAYVGLVACCVARQQAGTSGQEKPSRGWLLAAWRGFPRAHLLAGGFLILLLLPMVIDLWWGKESNFAAILRHTREVAGDRKSWLRSLLYFLQYGVYTSYQPAANFFGSYGPIGFLAFFRAHATLYAGWLLVVALLGQAPFAYLRTLTRVQSETPTAGLVDTRRFLACAALVGALAFVLALYWGTRQDGRMYYFNSWSSYAIYYYGALAASAVLCCMGIAHSTGPAAETGAGTTSARWPMTRLEGLVLVLLTGLLFADRLRVHDDYDPTGSHVTHENVERAIAASDAIHPSACKVLFVPDDYWPVSVGIGLQLAHAGEPFIVVGDRWKNTFGVQYDWRTLNAKTLRTGLTPWRIVSRGTALPGVPKDAPTYPVRDGAVITLTMPTLELSAVGSTAEFSFDPNGNAAGFALGGWAGPQTGGSWTEEPWAALSFHPLVVKGNSVEIFVDGQPLLIPAHGLTRQRVRLYFNGTSSSTEQSFSAAGSIHFTVPATTWNAAAARADAMASLAFEFPDAIIPATLDPSQPNGDPRDLAIFFQKVRLQVAP